MQKTNNSRILTCTQYDNTIRWTPGERLDHLFEQRCDALAKAGKKNHPAVIATEATYSFQELEDRANQTARYLARQGIGAGDRIGILVDKSFNTYVALLAILKVNAAYVPLDGSFPEDRIEFILSDAEAKALVSLSKFENKVSGLPLPVVFLDTSASDIDEQSSERLSREERGSDEEQLAYIIYTSGTTGKPKGVAVEHPSIVNFVNVAAEVYGYTDKDRVYQGMTIAFDFSVEELWVPLMVGAALVPGMSGNNLVGEDLSDFLLEHRITGLCCVPTLLATIEVDLPDLRVLLVSGEACPHDLVKRWCKKGRKMLNAYGPTEATVTATLTELYPDKPVTIGGPLPTYMIVILDEHEAKTIPNGQPGEVGIAGIGLAKEYLHRPDLTEEKFIPDFLDIEGNTSKRIYRTGDLGLITEDNEIEYLGRIDTQVKIRGYRIELTEIESIIMQMPQISQAVVDTHESEPGLKELVAYYSLRSEGLTLHHDDMWEELRAQLPGYMVPAYYEEMSVIPMTSSHKADRKALPPPIGPRFVGGSGTHVAPENETEEIVAAALANTLKIDLVSVEDNFFEDLGAHSLLMARFCAQVREQLTGVDISMRDVYKYPNVRDLAASLNIESEPTQPKRNETPYYQASDFQYYSCWALQTLYYLGFLGFSTWLFMESIVWLFASPDIISANIRGVTIVTGITIIYTIIPIAAKWLLIGRWKEQVIPIWSLAYFRFWLVRQLQEISPLSFLVGSPIYNMYLRLLGAKIGKGAVIQCAYFPVCTDLITVGAGTILRTDSVMLGYKAESGYIRTGPVTVGRDCFVGVSSVLDIHTNMSDNTQLGHVSSLHPHETIPDGKHYHGSPAVETKADYCKVEAKNCSTARRFTYSFFQLFNMLVLSVLIPVSIFFVTAPVLYPIMTEMSLLQVSKAAFYISFVMFFAYHIIKLLFMMVAPRLLSRLIVQDKEYVLYGFHYYIAQLISSISNSEFYNMVFGDSSFITTYLKAIGWNLNKVEQTGSNFGTEQSYDNPLLCEIGDGTMVADGLTMLNMQWSNSSFKMSKVSIGDHNYLGNSIYYPHDGKTGTNCLLATKAMVPIDGPIRENVGLLGSPSFEIPRATSRDKRMSAMDESEQKEKLKQKNRYNIFTMISYVLMLQLFTFATVMFLYMLWYFYIISFGGSYTLVTTPLLFSAFSIAYFGFMERATFGFGRMQPRTCSVYDPYYWKVEHYWKHSDSLIRYMFHGTPYKNILTRLMGAKVGRKVYDEGAFITEKMLVEIGDHSTLNIDCLVQSHSLEEGVFKSEHIKIGKGCTVGTRGLVHYGATMEDNSVLEPDSFLMKGETMSQSSIWQGNPAQEAVVALTPPTSEPQKTNETLDMETEQPSERPPDQTIPPTADTPQEDKRMKMQAIDQRMDLFEKQLEELQDDNKRLKLLLADSLLENHALKDKLAKHEK